MYIISCVADTVTTTKIETSETLEMLEMDRLEVSGAASQASIVISVNKTRSSCQHDFLSTGSLTSFTSIHPKENVGNTEHLIV